MIRNLPLIALGAVALAACNPEPENIVAGETPDPMATELANAAPVELPAAIAGTKTYRCKDNSLVTIDWLQGGQGANLRVGESSTPIRLKSAATGEPLSAEGGYTLAGGLEAPTITLTLPDKAEQACKA